ncbi:MAG: hypothetical protein ACTSWM_10070, partial [Alphaproteobacteria bacterium]
MLWVPQKGALLYETNLPTTGNNILGDTVIASATASVKGTPVEFIASTAFDSYWIEILVHDHVGANSEACLDILKGTSTEEVLIPNLLAGYAGSQGGVPFTVFNFPLYIPAGTRI